MNDQPDDHISASPAREYYTAQELADLALEWGASATLVDECGEVVIELDRYLTNSSVRLELGERSEFYSDAICSTWLFVPHAPHRFCDRWNRFPYFASFSVSYGDNDMPDVSKLGFVVRAAKVIEFDMYRKRQDIFLEILMFWYAMEFLQEGITNGQDNQAELRRSFASARFVQWWFGDDPSGAGDGGASNDGD